MSIRYVAAVLDRLSSLTAPETLVLVALADFASDDTRECWPSLKTIARRARLTERGVRKILRRLEARSLIETASGGHQYGANTASRYRLRFDYEGNRLEAPEPTLSTRGNAVPGGRNGETMKGERRDRQGGTGFPPSVIRSVIEPKSVLKTLDKRKSVDNSTPDRLEQLEGLKKLKGAAA